MKATQTGIGVSFLKAVGMLYPKEKRFFEDPYSEKLLPPPYKFFIWLMRSPKIFKMLMDLREKATPGLVGWMFCRFRYIDELLKESVAKNEIQSVVNLGAGMDCRAYYIPGLEKTDYFEIDHPSAIKQKIAKLEKIFKKLPGHVRFVPVDFEKQNLADELKKAGYDLNSKTLFIWEGVSQYISNQANEDVLKYVSQAAVGSKIVFTYILKSFIDGKNNHHGIKMMYKTMRKKNNPLWIYGLEPAKIKEYLTQFSLKLLEDVGREELTARYIKKINPELTAFEIERLAVAEKIG